MNSLRTLFEAEKHSQNDMLLDVYLTDDGSTDGTADAVKQKFSQVRILEGNGKLFWAEGMRNSWKEALKKPYDGFLLLNDDVELYPNVFDQLLATHRHSLSHHKQGGIYIGSTEDRYKGKLTYSGSVFRNRFLATYDRLVPNGTVQKCEMANANIMLVSKQVVNHIGILSHGYSHGMADYDYTLTASKKKIPILIAPNICGHCVNDHKDKYHGFAQKTLKERRAQLNNPTGLAFTSYKKYMWKFFPFRYPFVVFFGWFKLYFPSLYLKYFRPR